MTTSRWLLVITTLVLLADGVLIGQRCMYERRLAQQQATATKADTQLVETTRELGLERIEQAKTKAASKRAAVAQRVQVEVAHETSGDSDFAAWINERVGGD